MRVTFAASGPRALLLLAGIVFATCGAPRLLAPPPTPEEAERLVRQFQAQERTAAFARAYEAADSARARELAREYEAASRAEEERPFMSIRVKRGWVGPPFARRWSYVVEVREAGAPAPTYYRVSRGLVTRASPAQWRVPVP